MQGVVERQAAVRSRMARWMERCWILDTETTGLDDKASICEIAVIGHDGAPLLNTLVRPAGAIPEAATAIHGITNEMVADAPEWLDVWGLLCEVLPTRPVVIYNAEYDMRLMMQDCLRCGLMPADLEAQCAMLAYAAYVGEPSRGHPGQWRWQKLGAAARQMGVPIGQPQHRALGDCVTTLGVLRAVVGA